MKYLSKITGVLFILGMYSGIAQEINQKTTDTNGREKLLGVITEDGLTKDTFNQWYATHYENYQVDAALIGSLKEEMTGYKVLAFMGTWCGDSRREVPRFYKILKSIDYPVSEMTMIAVDNTRENYKKSPNGEEKGYNIIKVPTFIILKDGKEVNRIVESPKVSLEADLYAIVKGNSYVPNYKITPVD